MQIPVYNTSGAVVKQIELNDKVFGVPFNEAVVHQVMVAQQANARHGNADTKTRSEVEGSSHKLFRQKGTGNARMGSSRSPVRRKGGITFGPHPRDYGQATPKKMRQLALRCVLSAKARDGEIKVVESLQFAEPKTRDMLNILSALNVATSTLVANDTNDINLIKSARNITGVKTLPANLMNVVDLLSCQTLIITEAGIRKAEELWAPKEETYAAI